MKTEIIIERGKDNTFSAYSTHLQNHILIGTGKTVEEAKKDLQSAYEDMKNSYTLHNKPVPKVLQDLSFVYKYDVSAFFNQFSVINLSKFALKANISADMLRQYKAGQYISEPRAKEIETAAHTLGKELLTVKITV